MRSNDNFNFSPGWIKYYVMLCYGMVYYVTPQSAICSSCTQLGPKTTDLGLVCWFCRFYGQPRTYYRWRLPLSVSVFKALSTIFHSINSPDNYLWGCFRLFRAAFSEVVLAYARRPSLRLLSLVQGGLFCGYSHLCRAAFSEVVLTCARRPFLRLFSPVQSGLLWGCSHLCNTAFSEVVLTCAGRLFFPRLFSPV